MLTLGHVGMGTGRVAPFDRIFNHGVLVTPKEIENGAEIDALIIWGGEDISPSLYNENPSRFVWGSRGLSNRDSVESAAVSASVARGIPVIGVCRGAQLVCAMAGGRLIQHVENHGSSHLMQTFDDHIIKTTSVHHQMMYPFGVDHKLIAWSHERRSPVHINQFSEHDTTMDDKPEPEIVWFPKIKALAIQGHPEFVANPDTDPFVQYCLDLVDEYILNREPEDV